MVSPGARAFSILLAALILECIYTNKLELLVHRSNHSFHQNIIVTTVAATELLKYLECNVSCVYTVYLPCTLLHIIICEKE